MQNLLETQKKPQHLIQHYYKTTKHKNPGNPLKTCFHTAAVCIISMLVVSAFLAVLPERYYTMHTSVDYNKFYYPVAKNILGGRGITTENGAPAVRYPPGFPLVLAGVYGIGGMLSMPESISYRIFVLFCMACSTVLFFTIARSVWGLRGGYAASCLFITYPLLLWTTRTPNSETPFLVLFFAAVFFFWTGFQRTRTASPYYLFAGVCAGCASLVRPLGIGLGIVLAVTLFMLVRKKSLKKRLVIVLLVVIGNAAAIAPWEISVFTKTGKLLPLSTGGFYSTIIGLSYASKESEENKTIRHPEDVLELMEYFSAHYDVFRQERTTSLTRLFAVIGDAAVKQPAAFLKLYLIKAARCWYATDTRRFEGALIVVQTPYLILIALGSIGAFRQGKASRDLAVSLFIIMLYFWVLTIWVISIVRFMMPVISLLLMLVPGIWERQRFGNAAR